MRGFVLRFMFLNIVSAATFALGQQLQISEAVALSIDGPVDADGDFPDWIEIQNLGDASVELEGFSLSDSKNRWTFPGRTLEPGARIVVFASGKDRRVGELHTNFRIDADGETIVLSDQNGGEVDRLILPEMAAGQAYGRADDDEMTGYLLDATPETGGQIRIDPGLVPPDGSIPSGIAIMPMSATLWSDNDGAEIYYTTDGSDPTMADLRYTGSFDVVGSQVIRARAFVGNTASLPATFTWLSVDSIAMDQDLDPAVMMRENAPGWSEALGDVPLLLLAADSGELFGETGIHTRYEERGRDAEIQVSGTIVEADALPCQIRAGLRIHGGGARQFPKKSFRLYFRESYGEAELEYPLFRGSAVDRFRQLVLRSGGHDSWSDEGGSPVGWPFHATYLRDAFARETDRAMGLHAVRGRFVHVFVNARYRGLYSLQERPTRSHFQEHLGSPDGDWQILESDHEPQLDGRYLPEVVEGDIANWENVLTAAGGSDPLADLDALIDLEQLIDWFVAHMWAADFDWFGTGYLFNLEAEQQSNNWYMIAPGHEPVGAFFPLTWDAEVTLGSDLFAFSPKRTFAGDLTRISAAGTPAEIYDHLRQIPEFQMRFGDRVQRHFSVGGSLEKSAVRERWDSLRGGIESAVWLESARWGSSGRETTLLPDEHWHPECDWVGDMFLEKREAVFLEQLRQRELFSTVSAPTVDPAPGLVPVGTVVTFSTDGGTSVFYTLDGGDPKTAGVLYENEPIVVSSTTEIRARSVVDDVWSPLSELEYRVQYDRPVPGDLEISEVLLWPTPPTMEESDAGFDSVSDFVFVEITNLSGRSISLEGCSLSGCGEFAFMDKVFLARAEVLLLATDVDALAFRHQIDGNSVLGPMTINFQGSGGSLILKNDSGTLLDSVVIRRNPTVEFAEIQNRSLWKAEIENAEHVPSTGVNGDPGVKDRRFYNDWLVEYFTDAERDQPNLVGEAADPDGDSLVNLIEFATGADPRNADNLAEVMDASVFVLLFGSDTVGFAEFSLLVDASADVGIGIEISHDLVNWESASVSLQEVTTDGNQMRLKWRHFFPLTEFQPFANFRVRASLE